MTRTDEVVNLQSEDASAAPALHRRTRCRSCAGALAHEVVDLGLMPAANRYLANEAEVRSEQRYPLRVRVCGTCFLAQLDYDVPPDVLFADYAYFSSYSQSWLEHARAYSAMAIERFALNRDKFVVEIASNDGYLLRNFLAAGIACLGVDPSDSVGRAAIEAGIPTEIDFFGEETARRLRERGISADLLVANNVLAHVPELNDLIGGVPIILKRGGVFTAEFPHLLRLIEKVEFDTIYHEHYSYISLLALEGALERHAMQIFDIEELPTHGGSLRVYAAHRSDGRATSESVEKVRADERAAALDRAETYEKFAQAVESCRRAFLDFLSRARAEHKTVVGYGAAAKGVTFLNYCGVGADDIAFVTDRNPHKQGRLLPGCHIPITAPEEIARAKPDYVVVLPWNLRAEIAAQLAHIRTWGGRMVLAVPRMEFL